MDRITEWLRRLSDIHLDGFAKTASRCKRLATTATD